MRILVLGGGGREHALCWRIAQSPRVTALCCAPGNPGTGAVAQNLGLAADDPAQVVAAAREHRIDLVVVGPEAPLVRGVADALGEAGVPVFGPGKAAARIEGSKAYAKEIMAAAGVPTGAFDVFDDLEKAEARAAELGRVVVKADGLAAGKGVVVAHSADEAVAAVRELGATPAGARLVLEELLVGEEVSVIALCDGARYRLLPPARDHKRVGDGDTGPNTGGMGAYAPAGYVDDALLEGLGRSVIEPTLRELARRGSIFRGALYAGVMLTAQGPRVLEFNARFGDPETQPLMMLLDEDLVPLLEACAKGTLEGSGKVRSRGVAVGVVLAAHGYPQAPRAGDVITGLGDVPAEVAVFHAGTRSEDGALRTAGGRVLTVCARAGTLEQAREQAYGGVGRIRFEGMHYRRDIAQRGG
jgi:phosphoribosylamine--glycine ligase